MKYRSLAWLAALPLAAACGDAPTTRSADGGGPALAVAPATDLAALVTGNGTVEVSWTHGGAGVTRWNLYRRPLGGAWTAAKSSYDARTRRLLDTRYSTSIDVYDYRVRACDASGCTDSAPVRVTGLRLTAPRAVWVESNTADSVTLGWTPGDGPVQYTEIDRDLMNEYELVPAHLTRYTDTQPVPARANRWVLRSRNAVGRSADSVVVSVVPGREAAPPSVATDSVTVVRGRLVVWGRVQSVVGALTYGAQWSAEADMTPPGGSVQSEAVWDTLEHAVRMEMPLQYEGTYFARLWASNPYGTTHGAVVSAQFVRPAAPAGFSAAGTPDGTVAATWTHDGQHVDRWRLLRRPQGTDAWTIARTSSSVDARTLTNFTYDVNVDAWEWMVQACNGVLCAGSPVELVSGLRLHPPTGLHATSAEEFDVVLEWAPGAGPIVEYVVLRRASSGPVAQWQMPADATTFTDGSAQAGVTYWYVVWARNRAGSSPLSNEVQVAP